VHVLKETRKRKHCCDGAITDRWVER